MAAVVNWKTVRLLIEQCQLDRSYTPLSESRQQAISSAFQSAQPGVEQEVRDHLAHYVAARSAIATSPEGRLLRFSPWTAVVGSIVISAYFEIGVDLCFAGGLLLFAGVPWLSIHARLTEQFETKKRELRTALWKANHQEHGAPAAVQLTDPSNPISTVQFLVWQHNLVTRPQKIKEELDAIGNRLADSPSKTEFIESLQSLIDARKILVQQANKTLFPFMGLTALFAVIGFGADFAGYPPIPHLETLLVGSFAGTALSGAWLKFAPSMKEAEKTMRKSFNRAMAYMPEPKER